MRFGGDNPDQLEVTQYQKVYLIATDLRGFHRVPEEWLELIEPKKIQWDELTEEDAKQYLRQLTGEDDDES